MIICEFADCTENYNRKLRQQEVAVAVASPTPEATFASALAQDRRPEVFPLPGFFRAVRQTPTAGIKSERSDCNASRADHGIELSIELDRRPKARRGPAERRHGFLRLRGACGARPMGSCRPRQLRDVYKRQEEATA